MSLFVDVHGSSDHSVWCVFAKFCRLCTRAGCLCVIAQRHAVVWRPLALQNKARCTELLIKEAHAPPRRRSVAMLAHTLLPSFKFATLHHSIRGKKVYLAADGRLVCPHGECSNTIKSWLRREKIAVASFMPAPMRGGPRYRSYCDCKNTDGLNHRSIDGTGRTAPPLSLFEYLEAAGTELISVRGYRARLIPHLTGAYAMETGGICCSHGASRRSLIEKQKAGPLRSARRPGCDCVLPWHPARGGLFRNIQIGRYPTRAQACDDDSTEGEVLSEVEIGKAHSFDDEAPLSEGLAEVGANVEIGTPAQAHTRDDEAPLPSEGVVIVEVDTNVEIGKAHSFDDEAEVTPAQP